LYNRKQGNKYRSWEIARLRDDVRHFRTRVEWKAERRVC